MTQTPTGIDRYSARTFAREIADRMTATIHLELLDDNLAQCLAKFHRQEAWEYLEKLAAVFGAELVEIEPEQEPEPLDAEAVAARAAATEQQIADAGRGHLLK